MKEAKAKSFSNGGLTYSDDQLGFWSTRSVWKTRDFIKSL